MTPPKKICSLPELVKFQFSVMVRSTVNTAALGRTNPHWDCNQDPNFRIARDWGTIVNVTPSNAVTDARAPWHPRVRSC